MVNLSYTPCLVLNKSLDAGVAVAAATRNELHRVSQNIEAYPASQSLHVGRSNASIPGVQWSVCHVVTSQDSRPHFLK